MVPQGESYLLGSQNMTWPQIHTAIAELAGVAPPHISLNHSQAYLAAATDELRAALAGRAALSTREQAGMIGRYYWYSHAKAASDWLFTGSRAGCIDRSDLMAGGVASHLARDQDHHAAFGRHLPLPGNAGIGTLKTFRSLVVLKRPRQALWIAMRDHLVDFAGQIADIEEIRQLERSTAEAGTVHIVNEWRVRQQMPAVVRSILKTGELSWLDRNTWDAGTFTCSWAIEPRFLTEYIACSGRTMFAEAMGGQGTRVTFEGEFDLKPGLLGSLRQRRTAAVRLSGIHRHHDHTAQPACRGRDSGEAQDYPISAP